MAKTPRGGRPTKLTKKLQADLLKRIELGMPLAQACKRVGVSRGAVHGWVRRGEGRDKGRSPTPLFVNFVAALKKAQAGDVERRILRIEQAGKGGTVLERKTTVRTEKKTGDTVETTEERFTAPCWTADAWHLERAYPEDWGSQRHEMAELKRLYAETQKELAEIRARVGTTNAATGAADAPGVAPAGGGGANQPPAAPPAVDPVPRQPPGEGLQQPGG